METTKKKGGGERLKIEAAGGGRGIIWIGGALAAAAVGAAFAAHRARGRARGDRSRGAIDENKEEEKGLRSLLPPIEEQEAGVFSAASQENTSSEDKETEGNDNIDHREEECDFDSSVEIQETGEIHGSCKIPEMITEMKGSEIEDSVYKIGPIDGDVSIEEFSFWNGKPCAPEIQSEQSLTELENAHLPEEQEQICIEEDGEKREEGAEVIEACSAELSEDATWSAAPIEEEETSDIEQQLEIPEKTEDICGSDGRKTTKTLQDCIEQKQGQVFVDDSEEAQENACNDFKIVADILDIPHIEGEEEEEGSSIKSQEELELQLEDVGERGGEESEGSQNSSVESSGQAIWPEDEQVKVDDSMSISEMKHQLKISRNIEEVGVSICCTNFNNQLVQESVSDCVEINMPNNETSENSEESEIIPEEVEEEADDGQEQERLAVEEESEGEESIETGKFSIELEKCSVPMYEMKQELESSEKIDEMVDEAHSEGTENTTGGIQSFLPSDDKHKHVSIDSSVEAQEKVFINLDMETEIDLEHDIVNACSFTTDVAFNSSQGQNQQQEEKRLPSIENEMKLQFEVPKKTADFRQAEQDEEEHEQEVPKKGSETIVTYKEKGTDFVLIGSSKLFLLVLITLAVGLLAFVHPDHLHHYSLRLPKIYRQLYRLFFPSYNGALGEL